MSKSRLLATIGAVWLALLMAPGANALVINHTVQGTDNLYNTGWAGNPYGSAIGTGTDAQVVSLGGSAFDFSPFATVIEIATGSVVDAGATATDANGLGSLFRGLPVYSLIGIWSSTSTGITAIGSAFFVGASNTLAVPNASPAYLFLAENDGGFSDNSGFYSVQLMVNAPAPGTLALMAGALVLVAGLRKRRA